MIKYSDGLPEKQMLI